MILGRNLYSMFVLQAAEIKGMRWMAAEIQTLASETYLSAKLLVCGLWLSFLTFWWTSESVGRPRD